MFVLLVSIFVLAPSESFSTTAVSCTLSVPSSPFETNASSLMPSSTPLLLTNFASPIDAISVSASVFVLVGTALLGL